MNSPLSALQAQLARLGSAGSSNIQLPNRYNHAARTADPSLIGSSPLPVYWQQAPAPPPLTPTPTPPPTETPSPPETNLPGGNAGPGNSHSSGPSNTNQSSSAASDGPAFGRYTGETTPAPAGLPNGVVSSVSALSPALGLLATIGNFAANQNTTPTKAVNDNTVAPSPNAENLDATPTAPLDAAVVDAINSITSSPVEGPTVDASTSAPGNSGFNSSNESDAGPGEGSGSGNGGGDGNGDGNGGGDGNDGGNDGGRGRGHDGEDGGDGMAHGGRVISKHPPIHEDDLAQVFASHGRHDLLGQLIALRHYQHRGAR